jgi:hypothetical protein
MQKYKDLTELRNHFYDTMPKGTISAWDLIDWASNMFEEFDAYIDTPPSSEQWESHPAPATPIEADITEHLYVALNTLVRISKDKVSDNKYWQQAKDLCDKYHNPLRLPVSAPVEADFETALEAQLDTREENGFGLDSRHHNFEEGAKWAREYLKSQQAGAKLDADELWDEYSEHVDDDIDSLQNVAGCSVVTRRQFNKLIAKISVSPAPEQVDPVGFAKFVMQDPSVILRGKIDFDRLLSKYTASLQNKQV